MCNVITFYTQQYNGDYAIKLVLESCQSLSAHQCILRFDKGCVIFLEDKISKHAKSLTENHVALQFILVIMIRMKLIMKKHIDILL